MIEVHSKDVACGLHRGLYTRKMGVYYEYLFYTTRISTIVYPSVDRKEPLHELPTWIRVID